MFGQMTAGSWIYIGTQGILQGTYQTFAAAGETALRIARPRRAHDPDRRARRHGRRAAARRDDGRRRDPLRRGRSEPDRAPPRDALPRRGRGLARRRARARSSRGGRGPRAVGRAARATRPTCFPELVRRGEHVRPRHRPDGRARPAHRVRAGRGAVRGGGGAARARPGAVPTPRARVDRGARARDARVRPRSAATFSTTATTSEGRRRRRASRRRSRIRASSRRTSGRSSAGGSGPFRWAALSGDPADIAAIDRELGRLFPDDALLQRWLELAPRTASRSRACRRGSAGSATAIARARGSRSTSSCEPGRCRRRS